MLSLTTSHHCFTGNHSRRFRAAGSLNEVAAAASAAAAAARTGARGSQYWHDVAELHQYDSDKMCLLCSSRVGVGDGRGAVHCNWIVNHRPGMHCGAQVNHSAGRPESGLQLHDPCLSFTTAF
jgi:hypothetical protein